MKTRRLMVLVAVLAGLMAVPFQCRTPQEEFYRQRAVRHDELAAILRVAARRALKRGDSAGARQLEARAEALESQGSVYRWASYHRWEWPTRRGY